MNTKDKNRESREPLNATHGKDRIEIEKKEAEGLNDMDKFAPMDGDLGDESKDQGDLPIQERKSNNGYDPALGTGGSRDSGIPSGARNMHVVDAGKSGITAKKGDSYVDKDGEKKVAEEKKGETAKKSENTQN